MSDLRLIEYAVTDCFGDRCPDFDPECKCCKAWAEYDALASRNEVLEEAGGLRRLVEKLTMLRLQAFSGAYSSSVREPAHAEFERLMARPEVRNQLIDFAARSIKSGGNQ